VDPALPDEPGTTCRRFAFLGTGRTTPGAAPVRARRTGGRGPFGGDDVLEHLSDDAVVAQQQVHDLPLQDGGLKPTRADVDHGGDPDQA
jgi:hypothetical protein